ncbi:MAG: flagellar FliJ family protein [Thermoguttaceae bacterium]|nr:flagellar FliJ family protein [Thermoguttaceae bacterium]MBQ9798708.1 flagellar FliJ family protein [Thermoguttaceae bacterium]
MSPKFRFDALLKIRESEQNAKKDAFLDAQRRSQEALAALETLERALAAERNKSRIYRTGAALDPASLRARQEERRRLLERRDEAQKIYDILAEETEIKREELNEAIKEAKVLQKLKEKNEERRLEEERKRAQKELDEQATRQKIYERRQHSQDEEDETR